MPIVDSRTKNIRQVLSGMHFCGIDKVYQNLGSELGMILMFHHIDPAPVPRFAPNAHLTVHPEFADMAISILKRQGVEFVSLDDAVERTKKPIPGGGRFAAITIDDGFKDQLYAAGPIMNKHQVPYTVYVSTGLIERTAFPWWLALEALLKQQKSLMFPMPEGPLELDCSTDKDKVRAFDYLLHHLTVEVPEPDRLKIVREMCWLYKIDVDQLTDDLLLTWDEVHELASDPLCTIGAHTVTHPILSRLTNEEAKREIEQGTSVLEAELGERPKHFAYPYGYVAAAGEREFELAQSAGFTSAVTTRPGMIFAEHASHMLALPRISVNGLFQRKRYFSPMTSGLPTRVNNRWRKVV